MRAASIPSVVDLFERWGADPYDEEIAQLDHALQTAALARAEDAPPELLVAALLHDIGHLLDLETGRAADRDRDLHHEDTGAAWLRPLLPVTVTAPIALHVRAKRYLCAVDPSYTTGLSAGSVRSLERQGGPMTPDEAAAFASLPAHADAVRLRRWDDAGKVEGLEVPALDTYVPVLEVMALDGFRQP